jgi:hypothetical protein
MPTNQQIVNQGLSRGIELSKAIRRRNVDLEQAEQERIQALNKKNLQDQAFMELLGVPTMTDPITKELRVGQRQLQINPPSFDSESGEFGGTGISEKPFQRQAPTREAILRTQVTGDQERAFDKFLERTTPEEQTIHDTHTNLRNQIDPETKKGIVVGTNLKTGEVEKVGDNPLHIPKKVSTTVRSGMFEIDGEMMGKKGNRTQVIEYEDGSVELRDLGKIGSRSNSGKEDTELDFELNIADVQERADNIQNKRDRYLGGDFEDEFTREDFRTGINSDYAEIALEITRFASDKADKKILEIFHRGQKIFKGQRPFRMSRELFYEQELEKITEQYSNGEMDYEDYQAVAKFLEFKYKRYLQAEDSRRDSNEINFDNFNIPALTEEIK